MVGIIGLVYLLSVNGPSVRGNALGQELLLGGPIRFFGADSASVSVVGKAEGLRVARDGKVSRFTIGGQLPGVSVTYCRWNPSGTRAIIGDGHVWAAILQSGAVIALHSVADAWWMTDSKVSYMQAFGENGAVLPSANGTVFQRVAFEERRTISGLTLQYSTRDQTERIAFAAGSRVLFTTLGTVLSVEWPGVDVVSNGTGLYLATWIASRAGDGSDGCIIVERAGQKMPVIRMLRSTLFKRLEGAWWTGSNTIGIATSAGPFELNVMSWTFRRVKAANSRLAVPGSKFRVTVNERSGSVLAHIMVRKSK